MFAYLIDDRQRALGVFSSHTPSLILNTVFNTARLQSIVMFLAAISTEWSGTSSSSDKPKNRITCRFEFAMSSTDSSLKPPFQIPTSNILNSSNPEYAGCSAASDTGVQWTAITFSIMLQSSKWSICFRKFPFRVRRVTSYSEKLMLNT